MDKRFKFMKKIVPKGLSAPAPRDIYTCMPIKAKPVNLLFLVCCHGPQFQLLYVSASFCHIRLFCKFHVTVS